MAEVRSQQLLPPLKGPHEPSFPHIHLPSFVPESFLRYSPTSSRDSRSLLKICVFHADKITKSREFAEELCLWSFSTPQSCPFQCLRWYSY